MDSEKTENRAARPGGSWAGLLRGAFLLLIVVAALDQAIGAALRHAYFTQSSGLQYRTTYSLEKTTARLLVFGTSRANHHYVPAVFEETLGRDYYNVGRDGSSILYHAAILEGVLARYAPEVMVLDLTPDDFARSRSCYDRLAFLLPYYDGHPEIRPILLSRSRFERLKLLSRIYPFNSSLLTIAIGNLESNRRRKPDIQGYIPLHRTWNLPLGREERPRGAAIDTVLVRHFERFLDRAEGCGARLYVVVSPAFYERGPESPTIRIARESCAKHGVPFWDFAGEGLFLDRPNLFQDPYHLNHGGAEEFSRLVAERIRAFSP